MRFQVLRGNNTVKRNALKKVGGRDWEFVAGARFVVYVFVLGSLCRFIVL